MDSQRRQNFGDRRSYVEARAEGRLRPLALWLVDDVQSSVVAGLNLLAGLDDVAAGRKSNEEWDGNAWRATITTDGVSIENTHRPRLGGTYALDEARRIAHQYWQFLTDGQDQADAVAEWEEWNGRTHPLHGQL